MSNKCSILCGLPKNMVQLSSVSKVQRSGTLDNIVYPNVMSSQGQQITFQKKGRHLLHILIAILTIWSLPKVGEDTFGIWTLWHCPDLIVGGIWPTCKACDITTHCLTPSHSQHALSVQVLTESDHTDGKNLLLVRLSGR